MANRRGQWQKGQSGNPKGRGAALPPLSKEWLEKQRQLHLPDLLAQVMAQAKAGCRWSQRLLLDRWMPVPKDGIGLGVSIQAPTLNINFAATEQSEPPTFDAVLLDGEDRPIPKPEDAATIERQNVVPMRQLPGVWSKLVSNG